MLKIMLIILNKARLKYIADSCRHLKAFRARKALQLAGMFRVAGEEEDLVVCGEGSDGLDGGGAAGGVHVGEGVVEEEEAGHDEVKAEKLKS